MNTSIDTGSKTSIRLLIVDDHDLVREGLRAVFLNTEIRIVAEAVDGDAAISMVAEQEVGVVLLDISLPDRNGFDLLEQIKFLKPDLPVLMHSVHGTPHHVQRANALGADGFLVKGVSTKDELLAAVRTARKNGPP